MIDFETDIVIHRPIAEVFEYVSNASNNPRWNSAVTNVEPITDCEQPIDCEYRMHRIIGRKKVENLYRVLEYEKNKVLKVKTTKGPTPFTYKYSFEPIGNGTHLKLEGKVKEKGLPFKAPSFVAAHAIESGASKNLRTLKQILESS